MALTLAGFHKRALQLRASDTGVELTVHGADPRTIAFGDITAAAWMRVSARWSLRLAVRDQSAVRVDGFSAALKDDIHARLGAGGVQCAEEDADVRGRSWGALGLSETSTELQLRAPGDEGAPGKLILEVPVSGVTQCAKPNEKQLELQFAEDETGDTNAATLVSMSICDMGGTNALHEAVSSVATMDSSRDETVCEFGAQLGTFLTPRGRYALRLGRESVVMAGTTYEYRIPYDNVVNFFLLPKEDAQDHVMFVISLRAPIRQNQQRYQHLVAQFPKVEREVFVNLEDSEFATKKYEGLARSMQGPLPTLVAKTFKGLASKKVYVPGKFRNYNGAMHVKCSLKTASGLVFFLERSLIFVHKPATILSYDSVRSIEFARYSSTAAGGASTFDLVVSSRDPERRGDGSVVEFTFSGIERKAFSTLISFFDSKKLNIVNRPQSMQQQAMALLGGGGDDSEEDEEDSDFGAPAEESSSESDSEDEEGADGAGAGAGASAKPKPKKKKLAAKKAGAKKAGAKKAGSAKKAAAAASDSSSSGSDSDSSSSGSGSSSSGSDSSGSDSDSSDDDSSAAKATKKRKAGVAAGAAGSPAKQARTGEAQAMEE